jgi:hypothetical protein
VGCLSGCSAAGAARGAAAGEGRPASEGCLKRKASFPVAEVAKTSGGSGTFAQRQEAGRVAAVTYRLATEAGITQAGSPKTVHIRAVRESATGIDDHHWATKKYLDGVCLRDYYPASARACRRAAAQGGTPRAPIDYHRPCVQFIRLAAVTTWLQHLRC